MKVILIDDEPLALDILESKLNKLNDVIVADKFTSIDLYEKERLIKDIDCAFLDIEMPGINGIELAKSLLKINPDLFIVFVTAFKNYAVQAFELNAKDYLLKPISEQRVSKTVDRIKKHYRLYSKNESYMDQTLQINLFGDLSFQFNNDEVVRIKWRTTKARELFIYLIQNHGKPIPKTELMYMLWPDFNVEKASAQLYTSIYHIRNSLKRFKSYITIKNIHESYILITQNVKIDFIEWEKGIESLPPLCSEVLPDYEKIMYKFTNTYLEKDDFVWADPERHRLEKSWYKIASDIAVYYYDNKEWRKAEEWLTKICSISSEDEKSHLLLMKALAKQGNSFLVEKQYYQLRKNMYEIGISISPEINRWYNNFKQENLLY
ncbi:Two-component response regulator, SAPR family, consists of REC, wHTH and BTAD domains [Halobacillus alkaliphilus]|uniref:Two-component response regulator, SAPR family, consists of REC, wHTH and BTAD domains n=1 Tax=Halobacillus alkaliphilus TaxID=396056 RepID=A0A1I2M968_9BACI|nr:response regulator [Halobacillus alkaliphilus]SFF88044.1 Two-component response regulator, SAPR family, consists of REC, wHTH and BTAD domains [Halobacillus alkaliphilus]